MSIDKKIETTVVATMNHQYSPLLARPRKFVKFLKAKVKADTKSIRPMLSATVASFNKKAPLFFIAQVQQFSIYYLHPLGEAL